MQIGSVVSTASIQAILKLYDVSNVTLNSGSDDVLFLDSDTYRSVGSAGVWYEMKSYTVTQVNVDTVVGYTVSYDYYKQYATTTDYQVRVNGVLVDSVSDAIVGWMSRSANIAASLAVGDVISFHVKMESGGSQTQGFRNISLKGTISVVPDTPLVVA